jgi:hypothetical protein
MLNNLRLKIGWWILPKEFVAYKVRIPDWRVSIDTCWNCGVSLTREVAGDQLVEVDPKTGEVGDGC